MTVKYKTVITKAGAIKLAAATVPNGKKVNFTAMAVGDGGGTLPVPDPNQTKLVKEVWRHALNKISQDNKHKNYVVAELLIPPETGGFWMRELGLYDDTGTLIAVGNMAESYKPALAEGSGRAQTVRMVIMVSDIESVELTIDTSTVMATQDYVDDKLAEHEQSRRHPDATLTAKGFTQLSSATDSVSESVAATPKAVKAAYDLAKGKYTAQDASTAQKGIVQLSSATDSTSEALAATPKAVKAANDNANGRVPSGRRINGHALTDDFNISAQDIFNGQAVAIGNAADLNAYTTAGLYYQPANAQAQTGRNYPEANAGSLEVYKHAGITQIYRIYNSSRSYIRTLYSGTWSAWVKQYDASNKPSPADINAVNKGGDAMTGGLKIRAADALRIYDAAYGMIFRRSENNFYLIPTAKDQGENGAIGSLRPFYLDLTNGRVTMGNGAVINGGLGLGVVNGLGGNSIVLGDNDTGFKQNGAGILDVYANSAHVFRFVNGTLQSLKPLSVSGDITSSAWVYANRFSINSSSGSWIDMRNQNVIFGRNAVSTSSAQALLRQDHADRKFFVGGLGNSQFGFYMINNSRTANGTDAQAYLQNDGTWVCGGNGSFNDVYIRSDRRSKRNIRRIERALDKLDRIEGVLYEIQVCGRYEQSGGLIAQDVQNVQPELVTVDHNDQSGEPRLRLNYNGVIGMLVEAVKELRKEVRELKARM